MLDVQKLTITEATRLLRDKKTSALELVESCFANIKKRDAEVRAFLSLRERGALAEAREIDHKISKGEKAGRLAGIPIALKDNICVAGEATSAASKILAGFTPTYDAAIVKKLKAEGAIILGKTNLDEFAHGASTENSAYGPSHNPWDLERSPGGSSGGSAAAVAAGFCLAALGTDTGGSVRQPAGWCNLYGLRPTYGRASRYGLIAMTSSTDTPGTLAKTAADSALLLSVIAGHDDNDATSLPDSAPDYLTESPQSVSGLKIGVPKEFFGQITDSEVSEVLDQAVSDLKKLGVEIIEISLPHSDYGIAVYYIITPAEVSSNLARFDGVRYGYSSPEAGNLYEVYSKSRGEGFGPEAKRRIMLGTYALSSGYYDAYYKKAQKVRTVIKEEYEQALQKVDLILSPASPHPAIKLGEKADDPLAMYLEDIFTETSVMTGAPALSIPAGFVRGLPIGMQIMGPQLGEAKIFALAAAYEKEHNWVNRMAIF